MRLDTDLWPRVLKMAQCLCDEIDNSGLPELCFCGVMPGQQVAIDYADCNAKKNGMAWVRLVNASPYTVQGAPMTQPVSCDTPLQASLEVAIMRNLPIRDDGSPPTTAEMLAATELQFADMACMRRAILCCYDIALLGTYTPSGPAGSAVGGAWLVGITSLDDVDETC